MTGLDWDDIQGNVLRGYGLGHACHLVLSVTDPPVARGLLRRLLPEVTPATPWTAPPATTLNIAFTHRGLGALGVDAASLASFPVAFRDGMRARAAGRLGDAGASAPACWETGGVQHPSAHVLLMVHGSSAGAVDERRSRLLASALDGGMALVATERMASLPTPNGWGRRRVEHFGFADGVSQPAVEGALPPTTVAGHGTPLADGTWRPIRAGEFVLGYPDEEEDGGPPLPEPPDLVRNGTYLVCRKLAQDVAGFRRLVRDRARRLGLPHDLLAAKLMGRWASGAPLGAEEPDAGGVVAGLRFAGDGDGLVCPLGSHVRRANPRDALGRHPELVSRHRLLRRGMPYGPPLADGLLEDDGVDRGLVFMAYCADIARQFEFVQHEWLNDGNVFGIGHVQDPVAGQGAAGRGFALEQQEGPVLLDELPGLVEVRGGDYLFQPGLHGLAHLAGSS